MNTFKTIVFILLLLFSIDGFCNASKKDSVTIYNKGIGIEFTNILKYFIATSPNREYYWLVKYSRPIRENSLRFGWSTGVNWGGNSFAFIFTSYVGYQYSLLKLFGKKFDCYTGLDCVLYYHFINFGGAKFYKSIAVGIAPIIGMKYDIISRLSISCETDIFGYYYHISQGSWDNFGWKINQFRVLDLAIIFKF